MTVKDKYPSLDYEVIRVKYPVAVEKIKRWFLEREELVDNMGKMGADMTNDKVATAILAGVIQFDPRKLYDVFDSLGVRISVHEHPDAREHGGQSSFVYYNNIKWESRTAPSRIEAECNAFEDALDVINVEE